MHVNWFKNPDHVVYADIGEFVDNFEKETGIDNLKEKIAAFEVNPVKEGVILKGRKRTSIKLFIPDMTFDEHIDMGRKCGGNYHYLENGIKDCSGCMVPHRKYNYDFMMMRLAKFHKTLQSKELEG
ncbi:cysteine-rich small domain-containing protein [Ihubacter sp. rT4E-8]|uniref:cysteine-rich small domain-containing protein n=1 Tax=Ihubacter sp. rT4E-8 TaxID=3242369 RepID=UPI003CE88C63